MAFTSADRATLDGVGCVFGIYSELDRVDLSYGYHRFISWLNLERDFRDPFFLSIPSGS